MPTQDFNNLIVAVGLSAASGGMNFVESLPNSPRVAGDSFGSYTFGFLTEVFKDFAPSTIIQNFDTLEWRATLDSETAPNLMADLTPKSATITVSDVVDDNGIDRSGTIGITNLNVTFIGGSAVTASFRINNSREVSAYGAAGGGDAWHSCRLTLNVKTDEAFNEPRSIYVEDVQVRTVLAGQGGPSTGPSVPATPTATYPHPSLGADYVRFTTSAGYFGLDGTVSIIWSLNSDFSTTDGTGTEYAYFTNDDPNAAVTVYVRARVVAPYIGPWSDSASLYWEDPRPDL